jgi:hypothetical protein
MLTAKKLLITLTILSNISLMFTMTYEAKNIDLNSVYSDNLQGSQMKFYTVTLDSNLKENDLVIDAKMTGVNSTLFETPIVLVSLVIFFCKVNYF